MAALEWLPSAIISKTYKETDRTMDKKEIDYMKMAKRFAKSSGIDCKKLQEERDRNWFEKRNGMATRGF